MNSVDVLITFVPTEQSGQQPAMQAGYLPRPAPEQATLFTVFTWAGLALMGPLRLAALARAARRATAPLTPA